MNIFTKLFGKQEIQKPKQETTSMQIPFLQQFTQWNGNAYANDIYREAVDSIARNVGKIKGQHIVLYGDTKKVGADSRLTRLLQFQPNEYMSMYDFLYKITTHYYLYNNAFAYLDKDERGNVVAIYPITTSSATFMMDSTNRLFVQFRFRNGKEVILPYRDIIHLRRNFNDDELLGNSNEALFPTIELAHTQSEGMTQAIKSSAMIRGILKYTQILAPEKLKESRDQFVEDYLSISNNGGVVVTDGKMDYQNIEPKGITIDSEQMKTIQSKIYNYLGISEKIVNSTYNEDEWQAFFESVIEPLSLQMSLEFTRKIFNDREIAFGNQIVFDSNRMIFSSNKTKLDMIEKLLPKGVLTINQCLEILNLPPIGEEGEKRLQTLNLVDFNKANEYQLKDNQSKQDNQTNQNKQENQINQNKQENQEKQSNQDNQSKQDNQEKQENQEAGEDSQSKEENQR